jgi:hypothetical protein
MTKCGLVLRLGFLAGLFLIGVRDARAQYPAYGGRPVPNPYSRPVLSPYINLLNGGNPAVNYYGLVRPELQFASSLQQMGQQVALNQQQISDLQPFTLATTGHAAVFMNTSHYFQNLSGRPQGRTPATNANAPPLGGAAAPRR